MSGDNGTTSRAPYIEGGQGLNKRQKRLLETTNIEPMRACRGRNFSGGRSASNNRASVVERVSSSNTVQGRGHSHSSVDPNTPHLDGDVPFVRPTPPRLDIVLDSLLVEGLNYGEFDPETEAAILEKVAEGETPITPGSSSSAVIATEKKTRRVAKLKLPPPERQIFLHGKRQQREQEGKSDSEEDDDGGSESANISEDENGGLGSESDLDIAEEDDLREHAHSKNNEQGEDDGTEDEDEASSGDDANGFSNDSKINIDDLQHLSSFHRHLGHSLTNEDADKLVKIKLKYKWEIPAPNMLMSKWLGTNEQLVKNLSSDVVHGIKQKLYKHWLDTYKASGFADLDPRLRFYFSLCDSYQDILHCNKKPFYLKGEEDSVIMDAYLMHTLNHIFKTRDLVSKNNAKLSREEEGNDEELLDHGFTRPKVMFLLPLRSIAYRIVKRLIQLAPASNKTNVEHIDRFSEEFGTADVEEDDGSSKNKKPDKPKDFQRLFGGNNNDHFLIGIKLTKRCIKLYGDYYSSDIILASPLGLVTKIAEAGEEKEKDVDFLSSIEVLIIDHADVIAMQNWSHLNTVVEQLNRIPSKQHGTDIMRIRQWYLDGHARFYRQTILLGSFLNPDMNVLFSRSCLNYDGKIKLLTQYKGVLPKVLLQVRQVYDRFDAPSIVDMDDARLDYFCKKVFPKIKDSMEGGTMLFISSYFEFVRIRNFLKSQNASFCMLGEYTKPEDISRARVWFFEGKRKIILYTERAHFYYRYKIRGIKNLIIYSLPERKEFYPEIINMIEGSKNMMCTVLFSRFDYLRLERIVGTADAKRLVSSDKKIFVYC